MKFVLMPDGLSASWFRSLLAEQKVIGVKVGTFSSLLDTLRGLWLLPEIEDLYEQTFKTELLAQTDAFWSKSILVDERSTLDKVDASLRFLLSCLGTNERLSEFEVAASRIERYYNDLVRLHYSMSGIRPIDQVYTQQWLSNEDDEPIEQLELIYSEQLCSLEFWQQELVAKLMTKDKSSEAIKVLELLVSSLETMPSKQADILHLNQSLFQKTYGSAMEKPNNVRWLQCRDSLQECEVLVGIIQQLASEDVSLKDIVVVVPTGSDHATILPQMLNKAGILSSHIEASKTLFEWDVQLLKDLLTYCHLSDDDDLVPAPLSLACIFTNPLMPWSLAIGQRYAELHVAGKLRDEYLRDEDVVFVKHLLNPEIAQWKDWIVTILEALTLPKDMRVVSKKKMALLTDDLGLIRDKVSSSGEKISFLKLANQLSPKQVDIESTENINVLNGVLLVRESECLLQRVEHVFLIGFNQGNYEVGDNKKGVFEPDNLELLARKIPEMRDQKSVCQIRFERGFRRFLSSAKTSITLLLSQQTSAGDKLTPSETMMDMAFCFQDRDKVKPESLIQKIAELNNTPTFIKRESVPIKAPKAIRTTDDVSLDMNLFDLHQDKDGAQRPESPSSLEKMMISPFAWLLNRQGLEPKIWKPLTLDAALKGTLAHKVFELHASLNLTLASYNDSTTYDQLFSDALKQDAPFLQEPQWCLERSQLKQEIRDALLPFCEWCESEQWAFKDVEQMLVGELWSLPLKGFVDVILSNGRQHLILDYKKSKSDSRVKRLNAGFDLQTPIYRELYRQQGNTDKEVLSGYYTLNDQTILVSGVPKSSQLNHKSFGSDIDAQSAGAIDLIKQRIDELRIGKLKLNRIDDVKAWDKLGINAEYTLTESPLVRLFMKPAEENLND